MKTKIKGQKLPKSVFQTKQEHKPPTNEKIKLKLNKQQVFNLIVIIINIVIIIYFANKNIANYVKINNQNKEFIGTTTNLIFGRNYITLITASFFTIYTLLSNKVLFNKKQSLKEIPKTFLFYLILNILLFITFTKKVY